MMWRHLLAIDATLPIVRDVRTFARRHVDQFLKGAGAAAARPAVRRVTPRARMVKAVRARVERKRGAL
jgi:hypothetical protein